ncbi:hypothetical protein L1857_30245 [Amycolatopsis thermalba]|uniref:Uncharacterized protein n=1 Tax=Amycolatopsis thermalba TaxID=944492 RepID=A0ABY4P353_9PSEU|nr:MULTISPECIES: hypothetical protein [Amycolatopsis]UQS26784.1 hypothetical protein L1857_30245 [Amycolatopsis thermalba]
MRLSTTVPSGIPATVAMEPDITIAAARLAWRSGTMRIAMLTPIAQNTPLANPITSTASSADSRTRRSARRVQATRNGTPSPADTPCRVTISPATPTVTPRPGGLPG